MKMKLLSFILRIEKRISCYQILISFLIVNFWCLLYKSHLSLLFIQITSFTFIPNKHNLIINNKLVRLHMHIGICLISVYISNQFLYHANSNQSCLP